MSADRAEPDAVPARRSRVARRHDCRPCAGRGRCQPAAGPRGRRPVAGPGNTQGRDVLRGAVRRCRRDSRGAYPEAVFRALPHDAGAHRLLRWDPGHCSSLRPIVRRSVRAGVKTIMSCQTDTAAETGRRTTGTAGPRRRRALTVTWLISILLGATLQTASARETATPDPHTGTPGANWVIDAWRAYASKFTTPDGRVIDDANGGISHREGQGYALLIALRAGDRAGFDRLWTWTAGNLEVRGDHLAAWRWDPAHEPHVADRNSATDGDLLIPWALAEAGAKWHVPADTDAA